MTNRVLWGISISALVLAFIGILITITFEEPEIYNESETYVPKTRDVYLFTRVDENIEEEGLAIPPDMFSQDTIVVNQGDKVKIHFYNLEPVETQEHHTFTINDPAYNIHEDINAEENIVIEFTATKSGIFNYICTFHQPTMSGELVVLPVED
ncbi:cupredoxin domain-containing protein [Candidatus Nitrosopumilus sediminis]|uniref:Nitrous oxide reductase n=1 Tax=Candidatus Nitrosopumilus sediminis TaxID=1229909 RepID=K0BDK3_9ARCH|nr:cupredoxin domain-containing protein [Candidatus Nitrosopumilus sediminis]AFS83549.1 nitrous oxide reductase [Candidatus Nitrosopumilus sediminis]